MPSDNAWRSASKNSFMDSIFFILSSDKETQTNDVMSSAMIQSELKLKPPICEFPVG